MNCKVATFLAEHDCETELEKSAESNLKTEKFRMSRRIHIPVNRRITSYGGMHRRRIKNVRW